MEKFINPAPYGNMKSSMMSKSVDLIAYPNSKLINPYDGVIVFDRTPSCENFIKIKHEFNGDDIYSEFCNVGKSFVSPGDRIKQGQIIGHFTDDRISYSIKNNDDKKLDVSTYMKGVGPKKEEPKKEDPKKNKPIQDDPKLDDEPKLDIGNKNVGSGNVFLDTLLSPFSIANDITKGVGKNIKDAGKNIKKAFKEDYGNNKRLVEQIDKIKKIINN
jgi:hypothetical protein